MSNSAGNRRFAHFESTAAAFCARSLQDRGRLLAKLRDTRKISDISLQQIFQPSQSMMNQYIGLLALNTGDCRQRFHGFGHLLFEALRHDDFRFNINLPTGQF